MMLDSVEISKGDMKIRGTDLYINEIDDYALEAAMAIKKTYGAETFALTMGTLKSQEILYYAVAKGIDKVIRADGETGRPELVASTLIPALKEINPDLLLVGVQSEDWGGGEVGIYLSQALDMGLVYAVLEICEVNDKTVRVKKELGGGKMAELTVELPAVLCVASGIQPLQYLSAVKRKKARDATINPGGKLNLESAQTNIPGMLAYQFDEVCETPRGALAEMITGTRQEKAAKLLSIIQDSV